MIDSQKIWNSPKLPTLPTVAKRLLELSKDPDSGMDEVVAVIKTDPAISVKILKAINSSYFGLSTHVTSLENAVPLLGTTVVTSLALSFSLAEGSMSTGSAAEHFKNNWLQSVVQAVVAESLAQHCKNSLGCELFLVGLLLDVGKLAMLKAVTAEYAEVLERAEDDTEALEELENEMLGINHVEVGTRLMQDWKMPENISEAVRLHHAEIEEILEKKESEIFESLAVGRIASAAGDYFCTHRQWQSLEFLRKSFSDILQIDEDGLQGFLEEVRGRIDVVGELFSVSTSELLAPAELMSLANEQLAELAMHAHSRSEQVVAENRSLELEKEQLATKNDELEQKAVTDPLTGVYNRGFFDEFFAKEISRCERADAGVGLLFCDIDHFKQVNDTYGHQCGDEVLKRVSEVIANSLRKSDVVGRYGGEEFVILVLDTTIEELEMVAERIRRTLESLEIESDGHSLSVTISIGGVVAEPRGTATDFAAQMMAWADATMYECKRTGRNRVLVRPGGNMSASAPADQAASCDSSTSA